MSSLEISCYSYSVASQELVLLKEHFQKELQARLHRAAQWQLIKLINEAPTDM